ncbi:hypothetical protein GCM10011575_04060 [Microlunatus endophyticus]|uniref:Polymerase nucleotidyl transferase domain-containing protein n=1 Tax=Microlunatus endophyticus TaxID=1716077 RepID=A0A917S0U2_9ACTN|nr:nucleotidyltransferase domain-containing protein [Microlunatus endophyticus]GGL49129.1 hypothetical protein GCM10011575_04060 [Microlunatus endophyticus]
MTITAQQALAPLPDPYHRLYQRVLAVCQPDERIRGLWLSGSLARGTADPGSDLDLLFALADDSYDQFIAGWRDWLDALTSTLLVKQPPGRILIFTALTPELCRMDGVFEKVGHLPESPFRTRITVIDRDGLDAQIPAPVDGPGPDVDKIAGLLAEFWRVQAISAPMINGRKDLLAARSGIDLSIQMLYELFVETNQPLPPMGVKQFNARLTAAQRALLESFPPYGADVRSLTIAGRAVVDAMQTHGRAASERVGAVYPEELATAVRAELERRLPIE